jgi:hypothetical protein
MQYNTIIHYNTTILCSTLNVELHMELPIHQSIRTLCGKIIYKWETILVLRFTTLIYHAIKYSLGLHGEVNDNSLGRNCEVKN